VTEVNVFFLYCGTNNNAVVFAEYGTVDRVICYKLGKIEEDSRIVDMRLAGSC